MVNWNDPTAVDMFGIIGLIVIVFLIIMIIREGLSDGQGPWFE